MGARGVSGHPRKPLSYAPDKRMARKAHCLNLVLIDCKISQGSSRFFGGIIIMFIVSGHEPPEIFIY